MACMSSPPSNVLAESPFARGGMEAVVLASLARVNPDHLVQQVGFRVEGKEEQHGCSSFCFEALNRLVYSSTLRPKLVSLGRERPLLPRVVAAVASVLTSMSAIVLGGSSSSLPSLCAPEFTGSFPNCPESSNRPMKYI